MGDDGGLEAIALSGSVDRRVVEGLDDTDLHMARVARQDDASVYALVNPETALRPTNPANVAAFTRRGLLWVLPLDFGRLRLAATTPAVSTVVGAFWKLVDRLLVPSADPGPVWFNPEGVGDRPYFGRATEDDDRAWVEYRGARPWIEILTVHGLRLVVPTNKPRDGLELEADRPYRVRVSGARAQPGAAVALDRRDSMVDLPHFAVLDPRREGWTLEGEIDPSGLSRLRAQFAWWAGRRAGPV